jgi:undecaprenyl-diphosphatase
MESLHQLDVDIFRALNQAGEFELLDALMVAFTIVGISYVIVLIAVPLWMEKKREAAFDVVMLVVIVTVISEVVKILVDRQRPSMELSVVQTIISASGPSFPSAHASRAFAVALLVAFNSNRTWGIAAFIVATLIAISRVFLGVHWPSDILFGAFLGLLVAAMLAYLGRKSKAYQNIRKRVLDRLAPLVRGNHGARRPASDKAVET